MLSCENYGSITMVANPARPSDLFTKFHCQGVWKSADYGLTSSDPINTGHGGAMVVLRKSRSGEVNFSAREMSFGISEPHFRLRDRMLASKTRSTTKAGQF